MSVELALNQAETLVVAANAKLARLFLRSKGKQALEELSAPAPGDTDEASTPMDEDAAAHVFLKAVAQSADRAVETHHAQRLVICAPPYALCALRDGLSRTSRRLLVRELPQDITQDSPTEIAGWLQQNGV